MTTTNPQSAPDLAFEANVRRAYYDLRNAIIAEKSDLASRAGEAALKVLLDAKDTASRDEALRLKCEHSGLDVVLGRLDGDWRCQESLLKFTQSARRSIASNVDWYYQEAGQYALQIVDLDPESDNYAKGQSQAMRAHLYTLVHQRCLAKFDELFGSLTPPAVGV
jgi:hypothetical protein